MRPNRKHFAIARKTALEAWKFRVGDEVMVRVGRNYRHRLKDIPAFKLHTGTIEKINRSHQRPTVQVTNVVVCVPRSQHCQSRHKHFRAHALSTPSLCTSPVLVALACRTRCNVYLPCSSVS